jgi:glycosyltransferase involved in cell wall biosynthesis
VTSLHGSDVYGLNLPFLRGLNKKVILGSDACTANSRATAEKAQRISGRDDIPVIPMGVDIDFFSASAGRTSDLRHTGKPGRIVLYAGRLIDVKGVEYLIRAFPSVLEKHGDARLHIVGSGPLKKELVSLSGKLGLQGSVTFHDAVSQEELVRYYSMADVFVLPSIVNDKGESEGLGVVLLEAMACRVPVIGSAVGGIPDIIKDGETGLLAAEKDPIDLAERICRLLTDRDLRKKVTENGSRLVARKFSWVAIAGEYAALYERLVEPRRHSWERS